METKHLLINCANSQHGKNDTRLNTLAYLQPRKTQNENVTYVYLKKIILQFIFEQYLRIHREISVVCYTQLTSTFDYILQKIPTVNIQTTYFTFYINLLYLIIQPFYNISRLSAFIYCIHDFNVLFNVIRWTPPSSWYLVCLYSCS